MKRGSLTLLILFCVGIITVVGYRYDQYVLKRNYLVDANVPCDQSTEQCFMADCSPSDDPECDVTPYKKVEILASEAPACLIEHTCETFACTTESCSITTCSEDALEDGEVCAPKGSEDIAPAENQDTTASSTQEIL